jgi:23S rRNA pseudouridine1911/1915/1917 synthase
MYSGGEKRLLALPPEMKQLNSLVYRQLLHAWKLRFKHPRRDEELTLTAPLPEDFQTVLDFLADRP